MTSHRDQIPVDFHRHTAEGYTGEPDDWMADYRSPSFSEPDDAISARNRLELWIANDQDLVRHLKWKIAQPPCVGVEGETLLHWFDGLLYGESWQRSALTRHQREAVQLNADMIARHDFCRMDWNAIVKCIRDVQAEARESRHW